MQIFSKKMMKGQIFVSSVAIILLTLSTLVASLRSGVHPQVGIRHFNSFSDSSGASKNVVASKLDNPLRNPFFSNSLGTSVTSKTKLNAIRGPVRYSTNDWWECLLTLPTSRILSRTRFSILCNTLWTSFLVFYFKWKKINLSFPPIPHSILASALSLLLVFRTNSSYDRFWEGRRLWSGIIHASRDLARLAALYIDRSKHERIARLVLAFGTTLKQHLHGERNDTELMPILGDEDEVQAYQNLRNPPQQVLQVLCKELYKYVNLGCDSKVDLTVDTRKLIATDRMHHFHEALHQLTAAVCGCERLVKQPIPLSYSRHTSRFLFVFMYSLPVVLIPVLSWMTVPTMTITFWAFSSIQEIGHFIEEPFNRDLAIFSLDQYLGVMRSDLSETLQGVLKDVEECMGCKSSLDPPAKIPSHPFLFRRDEHFVYSAKACEYY